MTEASRTWTKERAQEVLCFNPAADSRSVDWQRSALECQGPAHKKHTRNCKLKKVQTKISERHKEADESLVSGLRFAHNSTA